MPVQIRKSLRAAATDGAYFRRSVLERLAMLLALTLPLVWIPVAVERAQLDAIARQQSNVDVQNLAHAFSEQVDATISTVDLSLLHLRTFWEQDPAAFAIAVEHLNDDLHGRLRLHVAVTDARGILVFSTGGPVDRADFSDREYVSVQLDSQDDELFISRLVPGRVPDTWLLQFTRPILADDGRVRGVIIASVQPSYFSRFYTKIDLGPDASISLVRRDGTIVARATRKGGNKDLGKGIVGYPFQQNRVFRRGAPESGHFYRQRGQVDGVERFFAWRDLPNYPLMVTVGQAAKDVYARYARQKAILTVVGASASLALALLGWVAIAASDKRRQAGRALAEAEARWKLALHASGDGVWDCDFKTGNVVLSPRANAILDVDTADVPSTLAAVQELIHPDDVQGSSRALQEHLAGRTPDYTAEYRVRLRDGGWRWIVVHGMVAQRGPDGRALRMVGTFANIDARKSEEQQMRYRANHDALTGLPNRLLFADRLEQTIRVAQRERTRLGVLYFDLDKFKPVNDTFGHAVGDALLVEVARRVGGSLRESDTLARIGGDEFAVLLPRCADAAQARKVGENILAQLNCEFQVEHHVLHISGSVGYALFPENGQDGEAMVRSADVAMYAAKAAGRGRVCGPAELAVTSSRVVGGHKKF
jgi:diguanylate cyclase (GGDEF)-like protein/PAS domain S-box-containing protein